MKFQVDISVWEKLKNSDEPIIMYGTGNGADKVMDKLTELGITLSGITASTTFVRNRTFRGFQVMPLSYFEEKFENFTVIVTFGTSIPDVMENIFAISEKHRVLVPCVPVIGTEIFDKDFLLKNEDKIDLAYSLMADDFSKKIYSGYVNFLLGGELSVLKEITTPESEAFLNILKLSQNETYIDIGAYRGDTVDTFLHYCGEKYEKIVCAEPDNKTFLKLTEHCKNLKDFCAVNAAVTDIDGEIGFFDAHGRQSSIGGSKMIPSVSLNTLCENAQPTYIKIDSEGCENEILSKGRDILKSYSPKLNVAVYHKSADIFTLPILINNINPDYKIHLRHHPYIPAWDTLLYCTL
ncbi:MAG: FkbM family methyltransferase [Clostridia bacterium]|nr:FkbM family methyltransferase [Clostridia bacterium]